MKRALAGALTGALLIGGLSAGPVSAKSQPAPAAPAPVTEGERYDRNPTILQDGKTTWLFFARSTADCDRIAGVPPCNPDSGTPNYDLMAMRSTDGGNTWGEPERVGENMTAHFHGRNSSAAKLGDTVWLFWASGGSGGPIFTFQRPSAGGNWVPGPTFGDEAGEEDPYYNVEAITLGKKNPKIVLYLDDAAAEKVVSRTFDGSSFGPAVEVQGGAKRSMPKAIVDKKGMVRLTMVSTDWVGDYGDVYVTSSADGATFTEPVQVVEAAAGVTNWDPTLVQQTNGTYYLLYAPDRGDGNQQLAVRVSEDFSSWSGEIDLTQPEGWWDYWPEVSAFGGNRLLAAWTSESPTSEGDDAGTGHIWMAAVKL